ncbi:MAG TPA: tetratricopeptide repeat protein [Symbiobacteriaceae bacterium]|jgi:tetratricopeptide (TPR) repeat protein
MRIRYGLGLLLVFAISLAVVWPQSARADTPTDPQRIADSRSRYELGRMYEQAGDLTRAEQYYQDALQLWPDNQDAKAALQRLIDARKPAPPPPEPFWRKWLSWLPTASPGAGSGTLVTTIMEALGWVFMAVSLLAVFIKLGRETIRLAILRSRGIPLLGLGNFNDPTGRLPGLPHQVATDMNDAGLTIYDEKGAVLPDFNFISESGFSQAQVLAKVLNMLNARQVDRINVDISLDDGVLDASVSLADSGNGYVRYLHVVSLDPNQFTAPGELTRVVAQLIADAILISLSRDPNTRGLLYQRMGDWSSALKEFVAAAEEARKTGKCGEFYQAFLNLGNLYSFLGLQDKSVQAYTEVAERTHNQTTLTLIEAAMACSYKNWQYQSPPDQQGNYEWAARQAMDKALASQVRTPLTSYVFACYYSLCGQMDECLRWLREAVAGDLGYLDYCLTDPDMENFRRWLHGRTPGEALGLRVG